MKQMGPVYVRLKTMTLNYQLNQLRNIGKKPNQLLK